MNYKTKLSLILLAVSLSTPIEAATTSASYYCSKGYRTIQIGDSIETVRAACGDPSTSNTLQEQVSTPINSEQWIYSLGAIKVKDTVINLPALAVTFRDQVVVNIDRSGASTSANAYCSVTGATVNLGDTQAAVLAACGKPNTINSRQLANSTPKETIQWTYNFGPYKPQMIFNFEKGALSQITTGDLGR